MNTLKTTTFVVALVISLGSAGCRKRRSEPVTPVSSESAQATPTTPSTQGPAATAPAAMSAANQVVLEKKFMSPETSWSAKTPDQKRSAYYAWCQQYMFGDAATKSRILGEINRTGLPPDDIKALQLENRKLTFPPLPLQ